MSTTAFISSNPAERLTSRFKNLVSGFHLRATKSLQTSITFAPTFAAALVEPAAAIADVMPGTFLRSRPTVEFLVLAAPRIEIPSIGAPRGCVREAN